VVINPSSIFQEPPVINHLPLPSYPVSDPSVVSYNTNEFPSPVMNKTVTPMFGNNTDDLDISKPKRKRTRHTTITKDLNAPPSNPVDISDHEILTGAVLKPSYDIGFPSSYSSYPDNSQSYDKPRIVTRSPQNELPTAPIPTPAPVIPNPVKPTSSNIDIYINFSREELLHLSTEEFEEHVRQISAMRTLTTSERNGIKRQRRLIKNRESAQASRQRKKDYVGDLEKKVDDLISGNAKLKEQYSSLTAENRHLKNEVEFLSQLVSRVKVY